MDNLQFVLLDRSGSQVEEWENAFAELVPDSIRDKFAMVTSVLGDLELPHKQFDCIVSPANSYGRLDGGFDHFLSVALSPNDLSKPTHLVQSVLYERWKGYAPPGTCTIIPLKDSTCENNPHQCSFIALCPTMRIPEDVAWNKEIVYNLMWSLLVSLDQHNSSVKKSGTGTPICKVLMTGLGTGTGNISAERCARQMALAVRDFVEACAQPVKWSSMVWKDAVPYAVDGRRTHSL